MADRLVVATVQQKMHLPQTLDEYQDDLRRFLRVAVNKQARLVVFPELGGLMAAPPILGDFRSNLLKIADRGRRKRAGAWARLVGVVADSAANLVNADFRTGLTALMDVAADEVWQNYASIFGKLAREFDITIVAPSAYLPDPSDGVIRNIACVFGTEGELLGHQAKVLLHPEDVGIAQAGAAWSVISTNVGQIGLILGSDVLYPEVGRVLAYQGAEMLICQAACTDATLYNKIRAGVLARMQDNQLFSAVSFLVGDNRFSRRRRTPFAGKSAILAPQELTPRRNGVLVEMGNVRSEGVLAAPWDFVALRKLWEESDTPVRQQLPVQQAGKQLAKLYAQLQTLPQPADSRLLPRPAPTDPRSNEPSSKESTDGKSAAQLSTDLKTLDDLAIVGSVSSRWPLPAMTGTRANGADDHNPDLSDDESNDIEFNPMFTDPVTDHQPNFDDETDEMDAVEDDGPKSEQQE